MLLTVKLHRCLTFVLLLVLPGATSITVLARKGGSIILMFSLANREDLTAVLKFGSKIAYGFIQDLHFRGRLHKSGSCGFYLHDLKTTDAGRYVSEVFANGKLLDSFTHDVHVVVHLTAQKGKALTFDELPHKAESVEHFTKAGRKQVWSRERGVLTDRLTEKNGRLIIVNFQSSDEGTYTAQTSTREILVTMTVTESRTDSEDKLDSTHEDETHITERVPAWVWTLIVVIVMWWF